MVGIAIAFALVTAHWVFVAFGIVSVAGLFSRVPREEQMLLDQFGSEYAAYT
jgi:protein-S-isoprenylcysteine O-methyltransferase Ste14